MHQYDPVSQSRWMGHRIAQVPQRITDEMIGASIYLVEHVDANLGYQAAATYRAAQRWVKAIEEGEHVWLSVAGAATPVGLGGLFADLIARGLVDVIVCTGANVYHDLHFACGLPVRHGEARVDDDDLRRDETTRIYDRFIHNRWTLKGQDLINQLYGREVFKRLTSPFSTATLLYELGKEFREDKFGYVIDRKGSFVLRAAEYDVPIFLDSGSNHSLAMDFVPLKLFEGLHVDTSPSQDILEAATLTVHTQPQLNVFLGEGGPRNFAQTTGPTASEIFYILFEGSAGSIRFTTADERTGGLSGSGESEAVTWGKYIDADPQREVVVWSEYTTTAPRVMAYVAGKAGSREPRRLITKKDEILSRFMEQIESSKEKRATEQASLREMLPHVIAAEKAAREKAGYKFEE